jgi:nucleoside-diphosphate-sugar epimerase
MSHRSLRKTLLLGGSGFMGSALGRRLEQEGCKTSYLKHSRPLCYNSTTLHVYDGSLSSFNWRLLEKEMPDVIYHFARIPGRGRLGRLLAAVQSSQANKRLLNWLAAQPKPPLLVFVAGTLSYGSRGNEPVDETADYQPTSFAREYAIGERPIVAAARQNRLPIQIMRPSWVYGPGSWFKSYYIKPMQQDGVIPGYGDGTGWMSLIHVDDTAAMIRYISLNGSVGENYNLFIGEPWSQDRFVEELVRLTHLPVLPVSLQHLAQHNGKVVAEALGFSLRVTTKHQALYAGFKASYPDHGQGLADILHSFHLIAQGQKSPANASAPAKAEKHAGSEYNGFGFPAITHA